VSVGADLRFQPLAAEHADALFEAFDDPRLAEAVTQRLARNGDPLGRGLRTTPPGDTAAGPVTGCARYTLPVRIEEDPAP
jgi:hypothetical protein